eukprot:4763958-Pleurochrysis_carterae.AAC.3
MSLRAQNSQYATAQTRAHSARAQRTRTAHAHSGRTCAHSTRTRQPTAHACAHGIRASACVHEPADSDRKSRGGRQERDRDDTATRCLQQEDGECKLVQQCNVLTWLALRLHAAPRLALTLKRLLPRHLSLPRFLSQHLSPVRYNCARKALGIGARDARLIALPRAAATECNARGGERLRSPAAATAAAARCPCSRSQRCAQHGAGPLRRDVHMRARRNRV